MPTPNVRVYLPHTQQEPILRAVNTILNGLVGASHGCFPYRHPSDRVDPVASDVHNDRAYSPELAVRFMALRNNLKAITSNRIRLDAFDIALLIFAVGVAKRAKTIEPQVARASKLRLENLRKRAMRALIKRNGLAAYQESANLCCRFEAWCRYHLLYFQLPRRNRPPVLKLLWRDQLTALESAAQQAIAERSQVTVSEEELHRQAKLALAELRRGRHYTTPMELLRNPQEAKEFMITFISERIDLGPLKSARATLCKRPAEIGKNIEVALIVKDDCDSSQGIPTTVPATPTPNPSIPAKALSSEQVQKAVASWIWTNVDPGYWQDVIEEVCTQVYKFGQLPSKTIATGSLEEIIQAHRPILNTYEYPILRGQLVEWLLNWTMNLTRNPYLACDVIKKGFAQAWLESGKIA